MDIQLRSQVIHDAAISYLCALSVKTAHRHRPVGHLRPTHGLTSPEAPRPRDPRPPEHGAHCARLVRAPPGARVTARPPFHPMSGCCSPRTIPARTIPAQSRHESEAHIEKYPDIPLLMVTSWYGHHAWSISASSKLSRTTNLRPRSSSARGSIPVRMASRRSPGRPISVPPRRSTSPRSGCGGSTPRCEERASMRSRRPPASRTSPWVEGQGAAIPNAASSMAGNGPLQKPGRLWAAGTCAFTSKRLATLPGSR